MNGEKKKYEKPSWEFVELPRNILLASAGRDPFSTNDVRFASVEDKTSVLKQRLSADNA